MQNYTLGSKFYITFTVVVIGLDIDTEVGTAIHYYKWFRTYAAFFKLVK